MTRYRFPEDRTSFIYQGPNQPILTPPRTVLKLYATEHGDELADILTTTEQHIQDSKLYTGPDGLVPEFLGPEDGFRVWAAVEGAEGPRYALQAQYPDLLQAGLSASALLGGDRGPTVDDGRPGDWWLDKAHRVLYGPRTEVWPEGISLGLEAVNLVGQQAYTHYQNEASSEWLIDHPLSFKPSVTLLDSFGEEIEGDVTYPQPSRVVARFSNPLSGTALMS